MRSPFCIKICSKCGKLLVAYEGNFNKNKGGKYGLRNDCKKCKHKYTYKYHEEHKEDINSKRMERYKENKDEELKRQRKYYETHKEEKSEYGKRYREEHKEEISEKGKTYRKNNPHIQFNRSNKRRSLEEGQGSGVSKEQWYEMMEFFDWKCAYSGIGLDKNNRTIDHIIPLSKNGLNEIWNCVPCFNNYNSSKYIRDMEEWYNQQLFFSKERLNKIYEWIEYAKKKWNTPR